jgi:REP element-mobilizing transposase RayT
MCTFLALVPPKISISGYVGTLKGRTAIRIFNRFRQLKEKPYWGNHSILGNLVLWARSEMIGYAEIGHVSV